MFLLIASILRYNPATGYAHNKDVSFNKDAERSITWLV